MNNRQTATTHLQLSVSVDIAVEARDTAEAAGQENLSLL